MEERRARRSPKGAPNHREPERLLAFLGQSGELGKGNWKMIIMYRPSNMYRKPLVKGINTSLDVLVIT